jgi:hypothetical protein
MWRPHLLAIFAMLIGSFCAHASPITTIAPAQMPKVGAVDPAFVSYNIEMVEVTGGRFWKPYDAPAQARHDAEVSAADPKQQGRLNADLYQYRPPIDLSNSRLRNLARAIGPAYVRVSGSWANTTFFQDDDNPPLKEPPAGFNQVLTRAEWKGVMDFARSVGAQMVTSFAVSPGTRDPEGVWMPEQARALMQFTRHSGGRLAAVEFMNEPTVAALHGAPKDYDAAAFAKDIAIFRVVLRQQAPSTLLLGPGGTAEGRPINLPVKIISSEAFLKATGPIFDALSYHFYGATSSRCVALGRGHGIKIDQALSAEWLARTDTVVTFYSGLRDTYLPGKPLWVTETAEAACGGDTFAAQFADTFRFVNQLGSLARHGVKVVMHNTLASSDYGLIDQDTLQPRPNYWAAVLWSRIMGTTVLDTGAQSDGALRIYAHCAKHERGGVAIVALNTSDEGRTLQLPTAGERFTLTAPGLNSVKVLLNGAELLARVDGRMPTIGGEEIHSGTLQLAAQSITFIRMPSASNSNCR